MEHADKIFDKFMYPFIIWKRNTESNLFECCYSNKKLSSVTVGMALDVYTKNPTYNRVIDLKVPQIINQETHSIYIEYVSDDILYEIHYPICNNVKILSTISHKIRLPLTNIVGILHILDDFKFNSELRKYIDIIKNSSNEIIALANDIIDILNLEQNNISLRNNLASLPEIAESCQKIVSGKIKNKAVSIKCKIDNDIPSKINIDSVRLEQIIINLLNNSIENTDSGQIIIIISSYKETNLCDCPFAYKQVKAPLVNILFKIKDTGNGIDDSKKEVIEKILDISDKTLDTKSTYKYSGFGLYISKKLCNMMNGHIWFKTENDIGSIFYFNIICEGYYL